MNDALVMEPVQAPCNVLRQRDDAFDACVHCVVCMRARKWECMNGMKSRDNS